jgi:hypothetical protein
MTVDRQKGNIIFECDACNETLETNTSNWDAAMNMLRHGGWKARKEDEEWVHYCDKCVGA